MDVLSSNHKHSCVNHQKGAYSSKEEKVACHGRAWIYLPKLHTHNSEGYILLPTHNLMRSEIKLIHTAE